MGITRSVRRTLDILLAGLVLSLSSGCRTFSTTTGGDAWARADRAVRERGDVAHAIDAAEEVVQLNLRNADATGFKAARCEVQDGRPRMTLDMAEGLIDTTNRQLDVAIQGGGFFKIKVTPTINNGEAYTRNGNFTINMHGELVVNIGDGDKLIPPITFPKNATDITISPDGTVTYRAGTGANSTKQKAGQIQLTSFVNPEGLRLIGGSVYVPTDASGPPWTGNPGDNATGSLLQGYLERSNVEVTRERMRLDFLHRWRESVVR